MQSNNVKLPNSRGWNPKLVHDMIHNQIYIGNYVYNKRENHDKIRPESEWIVRENNHPSIISRDQFDRCNKIMNENAVTRDVSEIRQTKHIHVFGGKLICNMCGGNMSAFKEPARKNGFRPSLFRCSRRTRMMDCENKKTINEMYAGPFILILGYSIILFTHTVRLPSGSGTSERCTLRFYLCFLYLTGSLFPSGKQKITLLLLFQKIAKFFQFFFRIF